MEEIIQIDCKRMAWHQFNRQKLSSDEMAAYDRKVLIAARDGNPHAILEYVEKGGDPNSADKDGRTGLHLATDIRCVEALLACNADASRPDRHGIIPLVFHIKRQHLGPKRPEIARLIEYNMKIGDVILWQEAVATAVDCAAIHYGKARKKQAANETKRRPAARRPEHRAFPAAKP